MNKALDFDHGKREFKIQIQASVSQLIAVAFSPADKQFWLKTRIASSIAIRGAILHNRRVLYGIGDKCNKLTDLNAPAATMPKLLIVALAPK